ncbi:hypothetical protein Cni_G17992 [Canna indica]|uniref:Bifunctional inhibitor/plant lipid transfer protein/seed storage helical domain-containing protein n=1 Tax=Canna indica TaxID=4628 RepID=A0AAQ3QFN6_9LILI|nr:hypothetical protein Cni_G17992 [Canna indica]
MPSSNGVIDASLGRATKHIPLPMPIGKKELSHSTTTAPIALVLWWCIIAPMTLCEKINVAVGDISDILPCLEMLIPCQNQVESGVLTPVCCNPLKDIIKHNHKCACAMFFNKDLLQNFNLSHEQVINMTVKCNARVSVHYCDEYVTMDDLRANSISPQSMESFCRPGSGCPSEGN